MEDIKNSEGYMDLTPYAALRRIDRGERKYRPLIYICSPFSGNIEANVNRAREFCRFAVDQGQIPVAPHLMFPQFMNDSEERDLIMFMDIVLLGKCKELWVLGDVITEGMKLEIDTAKRRRQTIRWFNNDFEEVEIL